MNASSTKPRTVPLAWVVFKIAVLLALLFYLLSLEKKIEEVDSPPATMTEVIRTPTVVGANTDLGTQYSDGLFAVSA
jgi:hypothetical protein